MRSSGAARSCEWVGNASTTTPTGSGAPPRTTRGSCWSRATRTSSPSADAILDRALATPEGLDLLAAKPRHGKHASVRWILVHLIEEYARHAGHADLIRESIDGGTDL